MDLLALGSHWMAAAAVAVATCHQANLGAKPTLARRQITDKITDPAKLMHHFAQDAKESQRAPLGPDWRPSGKAEFPLAWRPSFRRQAKSWGPLDGLLNWAQLAEGARSR